MKKHSGWGRGGGVRVSRTWGGVRVSRFEQANKEIEKRKLNQERKMNRTKKRFTRLIGSLLARAAPAQASPSLSRVG